MRKLLFVVLVCLFFYPAPEAAVANQSNPPTSSDKSMLMYRDFVSSCLETSIMEAIKKEYNIPYGSFENKYENNTISYGLNEGHDGFVAVAYVRPGNVDQVDRLTFHVIPDLIQYGKGIKLLKYERAADS